MNNSIQIMSSSDYESILESYRDRSNRRELVDEVDEEEEESQPQRHATEASACQPRSLAGPRLPSSIFTIIR